MNYNHDHKEKNTPNGNIEKSATKYESEKFMRFHNNFITRKIVQLVFDH